MSLLSLAGPGEGPLPLDPRLQAARDARVQMIERVLPTVVSIFNGAGGGAGVIIAPDGMALTNYHVIQGPAVAYRVGLADGSIHDAVLVGADPVGDVALIQIVGQATFPVAKLGDSDAVQAGDPVLAMGNPFLLATNLQPTVTLGIVSGLHRYQYPAGTLLEYTDCIQTDAAINPGNSGGPLINERGEVIGINGRISLEKRGKVNSGVAYAISIQQIKNFLDHLRGGLVADHATLGATVIDRQGRVVFEQVRENSEVARLGIQPGDELVAFAGRSMRTSNLFKNVLGIFPSGWRVELVYRRDGQNHEIRPRLLGVHRPGALKLTPIESSPTRPPNQEPATGFDLPPSLSNHYEAKDGYANFAYARRERDKLLERLDSRSGFVDRRGVWRISLVDRTGVEIQLALSDKVISWTTPKETHATEPNDTQDLDPPGSGGLLIALFQWRALMTDPRNSFRHLEYSGGFPDRDGTVLPALDTDRDGVVVRWMFDPETGELRCFEANVAADGVPCEIRFQDYRPLYEKFFPHRWEVTHGNETFGAFEVRAVEIEP